MEPESKDPRADAPRPAATTPMFRQYLAAKALHPDALLFFRMGDFFEMFFEDALVASKALDLTLTSRGKGTATDAPMCGVPAHAADGYIARLVRMGHRVAVCEQVEDPKTAKGLVRREVIRVVSPGTLTDPGALDARAPVYMASLVETRAAVGLSFADLSTGEFLVWDGDADGAREILAGYAPREVIFAESEAQDAPRSPLLNRLGDVVLSPKPAWMFAESSARKTLMTHYGVATLDGFGLGARPLAVASAGALLSFLQETQQSRLEHLETPRPVDTASCLVLDQTTRRNLEITRQISDPEGRATLAAVLDLTMTSMGGRLLRDWILRPLVERPAIEARHAAVHALLDRRAVRERLREALRPLPDLERLMGRVSLGTAGPRDLLAVRRSLEALPGIRTMTEEAGAGLLMGIASRISDLAGTAGLLARAIADDAPASAKDGGVVRDGYDAAVDRWRAAQRGARQTLADLETRERQRTGITNLKVRYNRVFGYYIEVSRSNLGSVPADYVRKQTIAGGERFVTPELKEFEETLLQAETELNAREAAIFGEILAAVASAGAAIRASARALAEIDVLACYAEAAESHGYVRPVMLDEPALRITGGRHPVVERIAVGDRFIPNDLTLDAASSQIIILTGPNMGGKSTYLRQTALIVLMAQAGSFVPAEAAEIGVADRIFCRVGASDNLAGGQSTFLIEMSETANILHSATPRSLVLLDEIGRGTATFDGLSIAWAVAEWLHENPSAHPRTLFATHYHELTELALTLPRVRNHHISAREYRDTVLFLRKVEEGPADRSYGIQVARLAGLPRDVIARAREILENLERNEFGRDGQPSLARRRGAGPASPSQLPLFVPASEAAQDPVIEELRSLDANGLTPLDALNLIARWKKSLE